MTNLITQQRYRALPAALYRDSDPTAPSSPSLIELNQHYLEELGVDSSWFQSEQGVHILAGKAVNDTNRPLSLAYSGHQFGQWVPVLGDGRAHMLGQLTAANGSLLDVQLKGSGRTPFSRGGDGRATLGAVLREYLVSEAMAGLGIPSTRAIAVLGTGDKVYRERALPGGILVRTAASHIRVGTFQYAASTLEPDGVRELADFVIANHFPLLAGSAQKYAELLDAVAARQASLIADWMLVGFIHGVMNTDNMSIVGETIDYGPCAFMDEFQPDKVFSSIDHAGRYAWNQQPAIALWNLTRLAETLLPLLDESAEQAAESAGEVLGRFGPRFRTCFHQGLHRKLGLKPEGKAAPFVDSTLAALADSAIDFTVFFDRLTRVAGGDDDALIIDLFSDEERGAAWLKVWREERSIDATTAADMRSANPAVIARNHRVEQAIRAAVDDHDLVPFRRLCRVLATPFELDHADEELQTPPSSDERVTQTFCGT